MESVLDVKHLMKSYGKQQALTDVTFAVRSGSCFGLLGPNGAGKSTTMKIVTGIVEADGGTAELFGMNAVKQRHTISRRIGYVPQAITLYEKLSAHDNLVFFGKMYGLQGKQLKKRISDVLELVGLTNKAKAAVRTFSGGMKRRINMAAAMLHEPALLILDEPTVGIDPQSRNHIFEMIRSLKAEGVTIIYSTHYMEEVEVLCDEVAIIDQGKVIAQGSLKQLLDRYSKKSVYAEIDGLQELPSFREAVNIDRKDNGWLIETDNVTDTMHHILQTAKEQQWELSRLEITRPSLENVFLSLTGTRLRD